MSALDRKLRRDLKGARATLVAILLVIVVGVAGFVAEASLYNNLEGSRRDYYASCRMADFWIDLKKAPLSAVQRLVELPGVTEVQPRIVFQTTIDLPHIHRPLNGQVISLPVESGAPVGAINGVVLRRGSWFTDQRLEEVIVTDAFAAARDIHPGQTIHLILNNRRQSLFVVGTAISSEFVYMMSPGSIAPDQENYGVFYVKQRFAEETLDFDGACNQAVGLLTPQWRDRPKRLLDEIERRLDEYGVFFATPRSLQASHSALRDEINGLRVAAIIMPVIFLGVAALILNILMTRLAEQQRVTVGTFKALGYTNGSLIWHYLKFGMVIGLIGGVLGSLAGYALSGALIEVYRIYYEFPRLDNRVFPLIYVGGVIISVIFAMLGTLRGVRAIVRLAPAEAMRAKPPAAGGAIALERRRRLWNALGFRWQMVARSVWRNKWRTVVGMLAAALGCSILLMAFYFQVSMDYLVRFQFDKVLLSDMDLALKDEHDRDALLEAQRLPGVDYAEPLLNVACEFRNGHRTKRLGITGITPGARLTVPRTADGKRIVPPTTGLVMSRRLAEMLDVQAGQDITIVPIRGRREPITAPITRLADGFLGLFTYADYDYLNRLVGEAEAVSSVQLLLTSNLDDRLALYRELKRLPAVQAVNDNEQARWNIAHVLIEPMKGVILVMVAFAGIIFFGSILTTSLVTISERRREIATFHVMGYDLRQVGGIFLRESMLVNVIGALVGLPLGLWLIILLLEEYSTELYRIPLELRPGTFIIAMILSVVFTWLSHLLTQHAINRSDWREALNARE